jgi:hypothetical protein
MRIRLSVLAMYLVGLGLGLLLSGCLDIRGFGPGGYNATLTFTPPKDPQGKTCIFQCEQMQSLCIDGVRKGYTGKDVPQCQKEYRMCYRDCGGTITGGKWE